jgi:hypothetical protein
MRKVRQEEARWGVRKLNSSSWPEGTPLGSAVAPPNTNIESRHATAVCECRPAGFAFMAFFIGHSPFTAVPRPNRYATHTHTQVEV